MPSLVNINRQARRIALHAASFLAAFSLLNLVAAAVGSAMNPPLFWYHRIAEGHVEVMRHITSTHGCVDMAVVGNSIAWVGVRPLTIAGRLDNVDEVYNASLLNSGAQIDVEWMEKAVIPTLDPAVLVLVPMSAYFSTTSPAARTLKESWTRAAETRTDPFAGINRWAVRTFPLFRFASRLSDFREWRGLLGGETPEENRYDRSALSRTEREWGWAGAPEDSFDPSSPQDRQAVEILRRELGRWSIDPRQVAIYRRFAADQERAGRDVVFVLPPVSQAFTRFHPNDREDVDRFRTTVRTIATAVGADVIDLTYGLPIREEDFTDTAHLNAHAAEIFSSEIAERLDAIEKPSWSCENRG